jgi:DNA-binding XRE family transcriptional regulator
MEFCIWLRLYRRKAKLSQKMVAEILGVSRQTVNYWETGKVNPRFSFEQMTKLCKVLECDISDLIF